MADVDLTAYAFAAGRGDRDAAADLIRATQYEVARFLRNLSGDADVDDLVQDTFLRALRALPDFEGRSSVRTWLFAIARRVAADHVRHITRRPRIAAVTDWVSSADAAESTGRPRFEEEHALTALLAGLPDDRREAFVATQVLGLSYAEAAEVCDCPVGTIRSRVARAREDLVAAIAAPSTTAGPSPLTVPAAHPATVSTHRPAPYPRAAPGTIAEQGDRTAERDRHTAQQYGHTSERDQHTAQWNVRTPERDDRAGGRNGHHAGWNGRRASA